MSDLCDECTARARKNILVLLMAGYRATMTADRIVVVRPDGAVFTQIDRAGALPGRWEIAREMFAPLVGQ